jgi:hypothetical protein
MPNYKTYYAILNFNTAEKKLDFGDFQIISVKQGSEAKEWREKISCKIVPHHILIKEFPNYVMQQDDFSGFNRMFDSMRELLLLFRLFKPGDIFFTNSLIEDEESGDSSIDLYNVGSPSASRYSFETNEIGKFNDFRRTIASSIGFRNKFFQFALEHFMAGVDKVFFYRIQGLGRIVDYVIALESLFLIDNKKYFLRGTIAERVSKFMKDEDAKVLVKKMYDERSDIVHGNYVNRAGRAWEAEKQEMKTLMDKFEVLMRDILVKLFDYNFPALQEVIQFMEGLYDPPREALEIMEAAKVKADKFFRK